MRRHIRHYGVLVRHRHFSHTVTVRDRTVRVLVPGLTEVRNGFGCDEDRVRAIHGSALHWNRAKSDQHQQD